jgi:hypothetical protein
LDRHDFTGIFIGYTSLEQNVVYINLNSDLMKSSHHAQFDEAWYLQGSKLLAAQLLYDLGVEADDDPISDSNPTITTVPAPYPLLVSKHIPHNLWKVPSAVNISISLSGALSNLIRLPLKLLELGLTPQSPVSMFLSHDYCLRDC